MSKHKKHPHHNPGPEDGEHKTEKENTSRHVHIEPGAQIDFVQGLKDQYEAAQTEDRTHKDRQLFWTKVASGLLLLTAILAFGQGLLTWTSITNNTKQFQIDQRPNVWIIQHSPTKGFHLVAGEPMWANIDLVNFGKQPALKTKGLGNVFIGPDAMYKADKWFASLGYGPLTSGPVSGPYAEFIVPPGIPDPEKPFGPYFSPTTQRPITQDEFRYIENTEEPFAMVGRLEYFDAFGNRYWSDFCISRYTTGSFPVCDRHNEMH